MKLIRFIRQEAVLSTAALLAVLSAFLVPPDAGYLSYLDLRTLAVLFALMAVMAGLRRQGVFDRLGRALLGAPAGCWRWSGCWWGCAFSAAWSLPTMSHC